MDWKGRGLRFWFGVRFNVMVVRMLFLYVDMPSLFF